MVIKKNRKGGKKNVIGKGRGRGKCTRPGPLTNNGYLNFLREFRQQPENCKLPNTVILKRAGKMWCKLTREQQKCFKYLGPKGKQKLAAKKALAQSRNRNRPSRGRGRSRLPQNKSRGRSASRRSKSAGANRSKSSKRGRSTTPKPKATKRNKSRGASKGFRPCNCPNAMRGGSRGRSASKGAGKNSKSRSPARAKGRKRC